MPFSGKTETTKYIEQKGFYKIYFGDATFDEIKKQGLETNEDNERKIREELREKHGMAAYAILNIAKIEEAYKDGNVIIESLYSWDEYKIIKEKFGDNFKVIAIFTPPSIRYDRVLGRIEEKHGTKRNFTKKSVQSRDYSQLENLATGGPIAMADYTIVNTGSIDNLYKKIDTIIK